MKFGKLENIEHVDFALPEDHLGNADRLTNNQYKEPKFYIGCTSWTSKEWKGKYYPAKTKSTDYLVEYGKQFNTIELNTTHYGIPKLEYIEKWVDHTPADFKFCPKVLKFISHSKDLGTDTDRIEEFCNVISTFGDKLGMCFIQLPPYFGFDRLKLIEKFLKIFPKEIELALELRHESFYNDKANLEQTIDLLSRYKRTFLITDVAGRRDILHMAISSGTAMIRFVGNNLHPTDYTRIDKWVSKLNSWKSLGLAKVYFFPHEPDNLRAPEISEYLYQEIIKTEGFKIRGPKSLEQQKSLF